MVGTLLVPLDGSKIGESALPWAVRLARNQSLSLTLLEVVPLPHVPSGQFGGYVSPTVYDAMLENEWRAATTYLADVSDRLHGEGHTVLTMVRRGAPTEVILDAAEKVSAQGIAIASHGRGGLSRLAFGSVAERLLGHATVPILLVRAREDGSSETPSFNRLLVPFDGSSFAEEGLELAKSFSLPGSTLLLVRIVEPIERLAPGFDEPVAFVDEEATREAVNAAGTYLTQLATSLGGSGLRAETMVRRGHAGAEILAAADEGRANLIVMATHGRTGPTRWFAGSVADEVFRLSGKPVFLVTARALAARTRASELPAAS